MRFLLIVLTGCATYTPEAAQILPPLLPGAPSSGTTRLTIEASQSMAQPASGAFEESVVRSNVTSFGPSWQVHRNIAVRAFAFLAWGASRAEADTSSPEQRAWALGPSLVFRIPAIPDRVDVFISVDAMIQAFAVHGTSCHDDFLSLGGGRCDDDDEWWSPREQIGLEMSARVWNSLRTIAFEVGMRVTSVPYADMESSSPPHAWLGIARANLIFALHERFEIVASGGVPFGQGPIRFGAVAQLGIRVNALGYST